MAVNQEFDLIVIGGGPGGYVGAIRAAQLGMKVVCIEADKLGGVCLNWGCIPTKALLAAASFYHRLKHDAADWGIKADNICHDWEQVIKRSRTVAAKLNRGVHHLFKKNKVAHIEGYAFVPKPGSVAVYDAQNAHHKGEPTHFLKGQHILVATGADPRALPDTAFDGDKIISSREAMALTPQPKRILIIGGGAIGMEFAYFYHAFGTQVTLVEMMDRLLPIEDHDISKAIKKSFKKTGISTMTATKIFDLERTESGIRAQVSPVTDESKAQTIESDVALVAIGVRGRYHGIFDRSLKIQTHENHLQVDRSTYATSVPGIYAVGDVIGPPWLAHVASEEAIVCVEKLAGHPGVNIDYNAIPACTYCEPQVASIGHTEQRCKEEGLEYTKATFPFQGSGKAQALGATEGFVKLLAGKPHGEILGGHMIGADVTEFIGEIALGQRLEATANELIATIHAHPTLSEAVHEAALGLDGRMIHF